MKNFAIHDGTEIVNIVVAQKIEDVTLATEMQVFEVIEPLGIGWIMQDGAWTDPTPAPEPFYTPLELLEPEVTDGSN